ncbi:MAG: alpha/beta hydrolase [Mycobacteriaceae bacterium]|nr:alpha/beta hydrolase [Mycobacteriaceae bacterium]
MNPPDARPQVRTIATADGAVLRVYVHGPADAPPIVLSHGWVCRADYWNPQIRALAGVDGTGPYRVVTYDQRGHGESTNGSRAALADVLADDLAEVLAETLRPGERAVLGGHSMGGMSIMAWARRHPEQAGLVGAILLLNTGCGRLLAETTVLPFIPAGKVPHRIGAAILGARLPLPPLWLLRPLAKMRIMPGGSPDAVDFTARMLLSCPPATRGRWGRMLAAMDLGGPAPIAGVPVSVLAGERDHLTPPVHAEGIAAEFGGDLRRFAVLPGVGHMGNLEAPDEVTAELLALARLVPAAPSEIAG